MARKNHKKNGREAKQRRQDRAAERQAEWDSLTASERKRRGEGQLRELRK